MASTRLHVRLGSETYVAEVVGAGAVLVESSGGVAEAHVMRAGTEDGTYRVTIGERTRRVFVAGPPNRRWVFCDGFVHEVDVEPEGGTRGKRAGAHGDALGAPMPATVVSIGVEPGQRVVRGDTLLMLEAMKMELPIRAPHDGIIARVNCREGDLVQPGVALLEFADGA